MQPEFKALLDILIRNGGLIKRKDLHRELESRTGQKMSDVKMRTIKRKLVIDYKYPIGSNDTGYWIVKTEAQKKIAMDEIDKKIGGLLELKVGITQGFERFKKKTTPEKVVSVASRKIKLIKKGE